MSNSHIIHKKRYLVIQKDKIGFNSFHKDKKLILIKILILNSQGAH